MGKCNIYYYATIPATPTSLHCYVGCTEFLFVYNFFRAMNIENGFDYDEKGLDYGSSDESDDYDDQVRQFPHTIQPLFWRLFQKSRPLLCLNALYL